MSQCLVWPEYTHTAWAKEGIYCPPSWESHQKAGLKDRRYRVILKLSLLFLPGPLSRINEEIVYNCLANSQLYMQFSMNYQMSECHING